MKRKQINLKFYLVKPIFAWEMTPAKNVNIFIFPFYFSSFIIIFIIVVVIVLIDHKGPLCEGCMLLDRAVKAVSGECVKCQSDPLVVLILAVVFLCFLVLIIFQT